MDDNELVEDQSLHVGMRRRQSKVHCVPDQVRDRLSPYFQLNARNGRGGRAPVPVLVPDRAHVHVHAYNRRASRLACTSSNVS